MAAAGLQTCDVVECLPRSEAPPTDKRQECVLLIEDDEEAMLIVRYAMQEYGNGTYRLEWADGLTAGLHRLSKGGVDLVLLDLGLPETSGPASYSAIRKAAPDLPLLVLTGDTREQTEVTIAADGVEDFLVKDEVSGALLLQAIRTALNSNRRWRERKNSAYKQTQRFHWADEKCQALYGLGLRLVKLNRAEAATACGKALAAIAENYAQGEDGTMEGRVDLLVTLERLARSAAATGHKDLARQFRALITLPPATDPAARVAFDHAMHERIAHLDQDPEQPTPDGASSDQADLAVVLRQILATIPGLT